MVDSVPSYFGACNIVVLDDLAYNFSAVLGTPLNNNSFQGDFYSGFFHVYPVSENMTITHLMKPSGRVPHFEGRVPHFELQKAILKTADVILLILHTTHPYFTWFGKLGELAHIPLICWINEGPKEALQSFRDAEKNRLLRMQNSQTKIQDAKQEANPNSSVKKCGMNSGPYFPFLDQHQLVKKVKEIHNSPQIFNVNLNGVHLMEISPFCQSIPVLQATKPDDHENVPRIQEDFLALFQIAEQVIQERGRNEEVQEAKMLNLEEYSWQARVQTRRQNPPRPKKFTGPKWCVDLKKIIGLGLVEN